MAVTLKMRIHVVPLKIRQPYQKIEHIAIPRPEFWVISEPGSPNYMYRKINDFVAIFT